MFICFIVIVKPSNDVQCLMRKPSNDSITLKGMFRGKTVFLISIILEICEKGEKWCIKRLVALLFYSTCAYIRKYCNIR